MPFYCLRSLDNLRVQLVDIAMKFQSYTTSSNFSVSTGICNDCIENIQIQ